jgi:anti-anti-sigma factor
VVVLHPNALYPGLKRAARGYMGRSMEDELSIRTSLQGSTATVTAAGEIDLSTVDELRTAVLTAVEGADRLRLDLTAVEFIDSAGLGGLLELRSTLRSRSVTLEIDAGDGPVRQAMEITGLSELLAPR